MRTLSGLVLPTAAQMNFMVVGDWLPDHTSISPLSTRTVTFNGSMQAWAT